MTRHLIAAIACAASLEWSGLAVGAAPPVAVAQSSAGKIPKVFELETYRPIEVAAGAPGTKPLVVADPGEASISRAALAKAQAYSDALQGHALLVWQGGKLLYEKYGDGLGEGTRFETFSMHKSILGLLYGAALRDGIVRSLDDRAGDYLAEWASDPRGAITLRQLLTMETGLALGHGDNKADVALTQPQDAPPGARFEYNNANPEIAGVILDRALRKAGKGDYAAYLSRVLLQPLGAGDAHLWLDHEGGEPRFYAFCQMGARDWLRVGIMIDHNGAFEGAQILPAAWIKTQTTPSALNPNYGILTWLGSPWSSLRPYGPRTPQKVIHSAPYLVSDLVFFDGFGGQRLYISPSLDLVIVRIGEPSYDFDDSAIPNAIIAGLKSARTHTIDLFWTCCRQVRGRGAPDWTADVRSN